MRISCSTLRTYVALVFVVLSLYSCSKEKQIGEQVDSYQYSVLLHNVTMKQVHAGCVGIVKADANKHLVSQNDSVVVVNTSDGNYDVTYYFATAEDGVRLRTKTSNVGTDIEHEHLKARDWAELVATRMGFKVN